MYDLRIAAILTANDDGSQAAATDPGAITKSVEIANQVYNPHGINFLFDPATDIYRFNDDGLNRDCKRRDHELYTNKDVDPAGNPELDGNLYNNRRNEVALRFPGRISVYFTAGNRYRWDKKEQRWIYGPRTFSWSNHFDEFVTMASWHVGNDGLAHELGHYLHLPHTFGHQPESLDAAVELIRKFVEEQNGSKDQVPKLLFDWDNIEDTPPDPGPSVFVNACNAAEASVNIPVVFSDGSKKVYTLTPDRENIMNYWDKWCRGGVARITAGQANRVLEALPKGNRKHLIDPAVLYFGVWGVGERSQTRAIGWAFNDFANRMQNELHANRRCVHMQAYDIGSGQIRYDGVWEQTNGQGQTFILGWTLQDFAKHFDNELKANRRCVHMQGYATGGGQVRYDAVFEGGGNHGQTRAIGWAFTDFASRMDEELKSNRRCVHMQAYDMGGDQIRYDGVWEQTNGQEQSFVLSWALQDFAKQFDNELKANRRCVHMQGYNIGGGQIRYDAVFESGGNQGQSRALSWAFNDFVSRCNQEAGAGKKLVHLQAYDIGGGQLRYDGVWESSKGQGQSRVLALPLTTFADHFDEKTSSGFHLQLMSACLRSYPVTQLVDSLQRSRKVFFGSDLLAQKATLEPLPSEPLTTRGSGCELGKPT